MTQQAASILTLYVIYNKPSDYPDLFVCRRFEGEMPREVVMTCETLGPIQQRLRALGLYCMSRHATDDPNIVETWL